jgi:hypothetical protein
MAELLGAQNFASATVGTFDTDVSNAIDLASNFDGVRVVELYILVDSGTAALHVGAAADTNSGLVIPADGISYSLGRVDPRQNPLIDGAGGSQSTGDWLAVPIA